MVGMVECWELSQGSALFLQRAGSISGLRSWTYSISCFFLNILVSWVWSWVLRSYLAIIFPHTCKAPSQRMVFIYTTMRMELRIQMLPWKSFEMSLPSVSSPRLVKVMPLTNVLHVCVCVPEHTWVCMWQEERVICDGLCLTLSTLYKRVHIY